MILWNIKNRRREFIFQTYDLDISILVIACDDQYIVSAGGYSIILWSLPKRKQVALLDGHQYGVKSLAIARNNKFIVSMDELYSIRVWKVKNY